MTPVASDCLFCKIIAGDIKGAIVHQDNDLVAIKDINPQAPLHVLIIPRQHIATINDLTAGTEIRESPGKRSIKIVTELVLGSVRAT